MGQPAPIPRRSSHLGSAACYGRSAHGSHSSTSAASSRSKRRQGNHNQFQTLKMFPDGHLGPANMARSFAVNAIGPALLMKHFLPLLPRSGKSVFAVLSAKVGSIGDNRLGGWYSYRASKLR